MAKHLEIGLAGERLACDFLLEQGYILLERNYRYKRAELDLIVKKGELVVFVEVKTRNRIDYGRPEDFVSYKKIDLVQSAAEAYLIDEDWHGPIRFDIISVILSKPPKIEHFVDAF